MTESKVSKTWVVALFPDTKEYSVVPVNWILDLDENSVIKLCQWPPGNVNSNVIKNAIEPNNSWKVFNIKIYGGNKTYNNFSKAWHQRVVIEESSTEIDDDILDKPNKKKCKGSKDNLFSVTSSDETDSDHGYEVLPIIKNKPKTKMINNSMTVTAVDSNLCVPSKTTNLVNYSAVLIKYFLLSDKCCVSLLEIKCKCFVIKMSCEQAVFISLCHDAF